MRLALVLPTIASLKKSNVPDFSPAPYKLICLSGQDVRQLSDCSDRLIHILIQRRHKGNPLSTCPLKLAKVLILSQVGFSGAMVATYP
ncbi:hypothetical protein [Fortiea contorta]|uniref:hypothetical protein n=1 Tax=Fortiea contorta TaxID=1892405 RepID=UPI0012B61251|nr:hypothetical protein [Fortiea contorta]